jgi:ABC-2 type transport system ATP-binding protein
MKRRVMIARAMVHAPKLLILDEPTAGVDIEIRRSMWKLMKEVNQQGTTIILTTHYLEEAESLCRNIAIIDQGKIVENTDMASLLARLNVDHFVLDLAEPLAAVPVLEGCLIERVSDKVLDVSIPKTIGLNQLFSQFSANNIKVLSLKNKSNRLEQLFMDLVESKSNNKKDMASAPSPPSGRGLG